MQNRAIKYFRKDRALRVLENPLEADLQSLLSATFALSRNRVVKKHIHNTLRQLNAVSYKMIA